MKFYEEYFFTTYSNLLSNRLTLHAHFQFSFSKAFTHESQKRRLKFLNSFNLKYQSLFFTVWTSLNFTMLWQYYYFYILILFFVISRNQILFYQTTFFQKNYYFPLNYLILYRLTFYDFSGCQHYAKYASPWNIPNYTPLLSYSSFPYPNYYCCQSLELTLKNPFFAKIQILVLIKLCDFQNQIMVFQVYLDTSNFFRKKLSKPRENFSLSPHSWLYH